MYSRSSIPNQNFKVAKNEESFPYCHFVLFFLIFIQQRFAVSNTNFSNFLDVFEGK